MDSALEVGRRLNLQHGSVSRSLAGSLSGILYASSTSAVALMALQETLGEGPSLWAGTDEMPVLVSDLESDPRGNWWVGFTREAMQRGIRSIYAFPLQIGAICLGVLTMHGGRPASLDREALRDLVGIRDAMAGTLLTPVEDAGETADRVLVHNQAITHQAAGMAMVQLGCTLEMAMARLRGHAYSTGLTLAEVAREVVARRLRFAPEARQGRERDQ